ncbi:hypothetical protein [Archangium primigenium]|uniref:hypothetical protein n=1 Tax=[Archangium] primigenium TaxID=2792470 RepID=UPI001956F01B|nr:hypothetical protein [Archangium primigenium]MBM7116513.1 hypothetical protein [Archangium primigenium]
MPWPCGTCDWSNLDNATACLVCKDPRINEVLDRPARAPALKTPSPPPGMGAPREGVEEPGNHLYPKKAHQHHAQTSRCLTRRHQDADIRQNQIAEETFVKRFQADPFSVWKELRERARRDPNFSFPELSELFDNMRRQLLTMAQRACCGERMKDMLIDSWVPDALRLELQGEAPALLLRDMDAIARQGYRYQDALRFCLKFVKVLDYITWRARTAWEVRGYKLDAALDKGLDTTGAVAHYKYSVRGDVVSGVQKARGDYARKWALVPHGKPSDTNTRFVHTRFEPYKHFAAGFSCFPESVTMMDVYDLASTSTAWPYDTGHTDRGSTLETLLADPDIVAVPTYNYLGSGFFTRTRGVPMCVIGMIDTEFIGADAICMSPLTFFDHDMFHIVGYPKNSDSTQLVHTMKFRLQELRAKVDGSLRDEDVYALWDRNAKKVFEWIDPMKDRKLRWALNILAFFVLHEPANLGDDTQNPPALAEPHAMRERLENPKLGERMLLRARNGDFGAPSQEVLAHLSPGGEAFTRLLAKLDELEVDPGQGLHGYATRKNGKLLSLPSRRTT